MTIGTLVQKVKFQRFMREYPGLVDLMDNHLFKNDTYAHHNYRDVLRFYHYHAYHLEVLDGRCNDVGDVIVHTRPRFDGDPIHYVGTFPDLQDVLDWITHEANMGVFERKLEADKKCGLQDQIDQLTITQTNMMHFIKRMI